MCEAFEPAGEWVTRSEEAYRGSREQQEKIYLC